MAGASLLALIDDIATILDDVATLTKIAAKKTSGVLGDDLALNAQQVSGVRADRELPVVWAVAKGSAVNKVILVPAALAISAFAPWGVAPLLMVGGTYLCFEGVEKLAHPFLHRRGAGNAHEAPKVPGGGADGSRTLERTKIRGAVRTDFVLSAEIVVITLGSVAEAPFVTQVAVLSAVAVLMTVGVYGLVAGIVKLDDAGLHLSQREGGSSWQRFQRAAGRGMLIVAPYMMKTLSVVGTAAMFLVGGGILTHGIGQVDTWKGGLTAGASGLPLVGWLVGALTPLVVDAVVGVIAGAIVLAIVMGVRGVVGLYRRG